VAPDYADGQKETHDDYDCGNSVYNYASISFSVGGVQWDPPLPGSLTNSFTSTAYVNVTSSDPDLCESPGRVNIGSCTWCVSVKTTNCASSGFYTLTNATVTPTNACLGTTFGASATSIVSNAIVVITTHCPCSTNADIKTTNSPAPTIVSNWWTASVGGFSTNGQGLSASFTPTNCGNGTVTFNLTYKNNTPCDTNLHTVSVSKSFVVSAKTLTFSDAPSRHKDPSKYPITWSARLQAVCQSATVESNYTVLASITYGFTIGTNGVVTATNPGAGGDIVVTSFSTDDTATDGGVTIRASYTSHCNCTNALQWVQTITTSFPLGGATSPYNDPQPPDDDLPYYWTRAENAASLSNCP